MSLLIEYILEYGILFIWFAASFSFVALVRWLSSTKQGKGLSGELYVQNLLKKLDRSKYHIFNDLTLLYEGKTTQIDHIVVSIYGVFIIETKNWSGKVYGGEFSKKWAKVVNGTSYLLHNPVSQNNYHVAFFKKIFSEFPFLEPISIVAFSGNAQVKTKSNSVVKISKLNQRILSYITKTLDPNQVERIVEKLKLYESKREEYSTLHGARRFKKKVN